MDINVYIGDKQWHRVKVNVDYNQMYGVVCIRRTLK